jgi:hypothetical protein
MRRKKLSGRGQQLFEPLIGSGVCKYFEIPVKKRPHW